LQSDPSGITDELDRVFDLDELNDEAEEQALKHALQSHEDPVLFLDGESRSDGGMVAYRFGNEWKLRSLPDDAPVEELSQLLHYTLSVVDCLRKKEAREDFGDYYSLRPLVYGGHYWLEKVCRQEFSRYQDLKEKGVLSVIVIPWNEDWSLFDLVESIRRGDRVGYFERLVGILLPFTNREQMQIVEERLKKRFDVGTSYCWQVERDFENVHELTNKVEELL
jgi:hypothetical protein